MIGEDRPGIARGLCSREIGGKPVQEIISIFVIKKDLAPINPPTDDVVKRPGDIDS